MAELIYAGDAGFFKACTKCGEVKPLGEFSRRASAADGRRSACAACEARAAAEWASNNLSRKRESNRLNEAKKRRNAGVPPLGGAMQCERCGVDCERTSGFRKYCDDCAYAVKRESSNAANARYEARRTEPRKRDPEKRKTYNDRYNAKNPDAARIRSAAYNEVNREEINRKARERNSTQKRREWRIAYEREQRKKPHVRLDQRMKTAIKLALKEGKAGRPWETIVGYTLDELKAHLERQFLPGMSWDNIGEWHIDHIVPKASYNYDDDNDPDFKACWALTNLRPLWARDNLSKGGKRRHLV